MSESVLEIKNLTITFPIDGKPAPAVDDVSFSVKRGEVLCLVGESGCGKSLTSMAIPGLLPDSAGVTVTGQILFEGSDLLRLPEKELDRVRASGISVIFQDPSASLNPAYSIGWQLMESIRVGNRVSRREAETLARDMLERVGIPSPAQRMEEFPHQLSGGMKQRVIIAMALSRSPSFLIADEPTTALDVTIQAQILELFNQIRQQRETSILFVTHDMGVVAEMADDILVMYAGQVVELDSTRGIFQNPAHPYTNGLLRGIPRPDRKDDKLYTIRGTVPQLGKSPQGCRFADRCEECRTLCRRKVPSLLNVGGKKVRCWKFTVEWNQT